MKIGIHQSEGSFSSRWIAYCKKVGIDYKIVNCHQSDIIEQLKDCDALMWHHHHGLYKDVITAKKILFALEHAGIKVFPDFKTGWHFDDKVAQKYLLEAVGAPLVPSYVFYDKKEALNWANSVAFPKVFKLKGGAGAANVKLVRTKASAIKLINRAFGKGFSQFDRLWYFKDRYNLFRAGKDTLMGVAKSFGRMFISTEFAKLQPNEKGYVYFQEFIPNNSFDIRVIVIGEKAFAVKRLTRENDFRASGSGNPKYDISHIDIRCVELAFELNKKINAQSIAYDFVFDTENNPLIVEICYGFAISFYDPCPGYWDIKLIWHEAQFNPQEWMVEELIKEINK